MNTFVLPGRLEEKVLPFAMPLIDAFEDLLGTEVFSKLLEKGIIRIESIAYLRGRTLKGLVSSSRCL